MSVLKVLRTLGERVGESRDDPKRSFSQYDLKVWEGWKVDLVEPVVTGTSSGQFSIFVEHGPVMSSSFVDVPLTNHFEAELEV
jgi:hypothetical protein